MNAVEIAPSPYTATISAIIERSGLPTSDLHVDADISWVVASHETRVIGVVGLQHAGTAALLRSLAVLPDQRKRGLGASLTAEAEELAKRMGITSLYLLTEGAHKYFEALGYRQIERTNVPKEVRNFSQFTRLCPDSASCLMKRLTLANRPLMMGRD